jgi:hypothetical protein
VVLGSVLLCIALVRIMAAPASSWLARAPEAIESVAQKIQMSGGPVAQIEETAAKVEEIATGGRPQARPAATPQAPRTPLLRRMFGDLTDFVGGIFSVIACRVKSQTRSKPL